MMINKRINKSDKKVILRVIAKMVLKWKIIALINVSRSLRAVIGITETSSLRFFNKTLYLRHFVIE